MKRQGKDFSGRDAPLFPSMIVQAQEQNWKEWVLRPSLLLLPPHSHPTACPAISQHTWPLYEQEFKDNQVKESPKPQKISDTPQSHNQEYTTDSHHTPATTQPSTSKPQKKQSRRKQRKDTEDPQLSGPTEPVTDDTENVASVPTHSNDPLLQKKRVEEAGKEKKSKPLWDERLFKIGRSAQVVSFEDEVFYMVRSLQKQDVVEKEVSTAEVATTTTVDELTLAWTLIEIKAAKPKARGVIVQEPNAELEEEEKLARQREEDANIAEWDNVQAMMDADYELAARLQA
ncbi:hypothetical protein Tco_0377501 [Tanacetum coccineum]